MKCCNRNCYQGRDCPNHAMSETFSGSKKLDAVLVVVGTFGIAVLLFLGV